MVEGVEPDRVTTFEGDLQRVLTDQRHVSDAQLVGGETRQSRKAPGRAALAAALSAWAGPAEALA